MEDVDRIQLELEALLSAATIRRKTLSTEIKLINSLDKRRSRPVTTVLISVIYSIVSWVIAYLVFVT